MPFALSLLLTLLSAACCNVSTPRAEPRLPAWLGWGGGAAPLVPAVTALVQGAGMSTFTAILTVLTLWMIALPGVGVLLAVLRAVLRARGRRAHG